MNTKVPRRNFITRLSALFGASMALPLVGVSQGINELKDDMNLNPIKRIKPLGFQWETADPFLFCVHHEDYFPKGNGNMGPDAAYFKGRHLGDDFIVKDGFRMYHGKSVPGFPGHPHRGFETITVVRKGVVDHADSMGAAGRYGNGDVQWMTAGKGVQHSEMFPLIFDDKENTMELFQIWLNLPRKSKMVEPHFKMMWRESIPVYVHRDGLDKETKIEVIAGQLMDKIAPAPPPDSWAADESNEVAVWNIKMSAGATWQLPKAGKGINRTLYIYEGDGVKVHEAVIHKYHAVELDAMHNTMITAGSQSASILLLQGRPINEPVIQYGPFVMNSKEEINKAFEDYHATQFGGWPWSRYDQVHAKDKSRFALHADGKLESKEW